MSEHEGMQTRREAIAHLCETWAKADKMRDEGNGKLAHILTFHAHGVLVVLRRGWGSATWNVRDLAHELALVENDWYDARTMRSITALEADRMEANS